MTARWVVEEVAPERDLKVNWRPISLLFKNNPAPDSEYYAPVLKTHKMLRVMEAVMASAQSIAERYFQAGPTPVWTEELV